VSGTWQLFRLALRRDRVMAPVWIAVFAIVAASSAATAKGLYPTIAGRVAAANTSNGTPALVALYGFIYDPTSLGALAVFKLSGVGSALVALLGIVLVVRHTRAEEESGRVELVSAGVVGRYAPVTAALLVAVGANLVLGGCTAAGLAGAGLPAAGSVAFGAAWAAAGIVFAAVAAVTAQLTTVARAATGLAGALLGVAYLLRAAGDASSATWLSWLSPIGWGQQLRPYAQERWWVLPIPLAFTLLVVAVAYGLVARRDLGAGILPDRPGPARGTIRGPLELAWRLQRGTLVGWTAGAAVLGAVLGNIASNVGGFLESDQAREAFSRLGGGQQNLTDAFLAADLSIAGVMVAAFGVQAALRLRAEETGLRAEPVLATGVGRVRWAASHLTVALAGTALLMLVTGLAAGLSYGIQQHDLGTLWPILGGAVGQVPGAWVIVGCTVAAFGLAPRASVTGWVVLFAVLVVGEFGALLGLKQWVLDLSPYAHLPRLPGGAVNIAPLAWVLAIAVLLAVTGLASFRRRDLAA
jgi:polyether ionophore transport system permease protein